MREEALCSALPFIGRRRVQPIRTVFVLVFTFHAKYIAGEDYAYLTYIHTDSIRHPHSDMSTISSYMTKTLTDPRLINSGTIPIHGFETAMKNKKIEWFEHETDQMNSDTQKPKTVSSVSGTLLRT